MDILKEHLHKAITGWKPNLLGYGRNFYEEFLIVGKFCGYEYRRAKAWYDKATSNKAMLPKTVRVAFQYISDRAMYENEMRSLGYIIASETMDSYWPHLIRTLYVMKQDYSLDDLE